MLLYAIHNADWHRVHLPHDRVLQEVELLLQGDFIKNLFEFFAELSFKKCSYVVFCCKHFCLQIFVLFRERILMIVFQLEGFVVKCDHGAANLVILIKHWTKCMIIFS